MTRLFRAMVSNVVASVLLLAASPVIAAPADPDAVLRSLVGKNEAAVLQRLGPPDSSERNGVQTFLRYRAADWYRTGTRPDPFGFSQGYSGGTGFRGTASFRCVTTLVLVDDVVHSYTRSGNGCR